MTGWIYVLHFHKPLGHSRHYVGSTQRLRERLTVHAQGHGSRLTRELFIRGVGWHLAGLFQAPRDWMRKVERICKDQNHAKRFCSACHDDPEADGPRYCPPAVRPYDVGNLPFEATSAALLGAAGPPRVRVAMSRAEQRPILDQAIKRLMKHDGDALGFVPVGGPTGMTQLIDTCRLAVAWAGRRVVGYAAWTRNLSTTRLKIHQLTVDDAFRLCGVGRRLVEAVHEVQRNVPLVCTVRSDLPANEFWTAIGFKARREVPHKSSGSTLIHYERSARHAV